MDTDELTELAQQLRVDSVRAADAAGSGHPTSSMSAADLMAALLANHLHYDFAHPDHPGNDRLIFSKGHASPLLYSMYLAAGAVDDDEFLTYRKAGSRLEGHPTPRLPWVDVATGSLGQGLPIGVGMALAGQRLERTPYRVWVLSGDSEMAEGSVWEAAENAGDQHLDTLALIVDVNRLGQRGPTRHQRDLDAYGRRLRAFGWHTVEIDGHDMQAVEHALNEAESVAGRPTAIIAGTRKGRGVHAVEDREGMHGKPLKDAAAAIEELGGRRSIRVSVARPPQAAPRSGPGGTGRPDLPRYELGDAVATRNAFGEAVTALGHAYGDLVVLDGEVGDSTRAEFFAKEHPERYFECYIAEQQLVAAAVGMQALGRVPYAGSFAAFLTRAHDFLRMATVSRADLVVFGSHAGVSIGEDGPSQMGLEDLAMFRSLHGSTVLHPCDANQAARLTAAVYGLSGIRYLRTLRSETPVIYGPDEEFPIGGSKVLRRSDADRVTLIGAGATVHECLAAADMLEQDGVAARVVDMYSVKPVDEQVLRAAADDTDCLVTVEDHRPQGGLGDAVAEAFSDGGPAPRRLVRLAVSGEPGSATGQEQRRAAGIDAESIAAGVRLLTEKVIR
jgi:transketolase